MTPKGNPQLILRIPPELGKLLARDAKKERSSEQTIVLAALANHYGIEVAAPVRGKPKAAKQ